MERWESDGSNSMQRSLKVWARCNTVSPVARVMRERWRGKRVTKALDPLIALGGDGTISEVVDGMMATGRSPDALPLLGLLPYGTGGDFRRSLAMPAQVRKAACRLASGSTQLVDVGRVRHTMPEGGERCHHFINIASFGISGVVDELINTGSKVLGGRIGFAWATTRALWRFRAPLVRLTVGQHEPIETRIQLVAVANGQYFGGGMHVAPDAKLDDGKFDVVIVSAMNRTTFARRALRVYRGTHASLREVTIVRADTVRAEPLEGDRVLLDIDGEGLGILPATVEIIPQALRLQC